MLHMRATKPTQIECLWFRMPYTVHHRTPTESSPAYIEATIDAIEYKFRNDGRTLWVWDRRCSNWVVARLGLLLQMRLKDICDHAKTQGFI